MLRQRASVIRSQQGLTAGVRLAALPCTRHCVRKLPVLISSTGAGAHSRSRAVHQRKLSVQVFSMAEPSPSATLAPAEPGKTVLGFVGIGIMGLAMTRNLLKAGYEVVVYNRSADKCAPLVQEGAKAASTAKEVAEKATYVFAMLSDPEAALAVATSPDGVAAGLSKGKGYVDVSTVDAGTSAAVAKAVRATGASFLEAPVSGSKGPAEQGKLIFLTAGDEALFTAVAAPLDAMGKAKYFLGDVGAGANMKLVVNMMLGSCIASFAEALALGDKAGLKQSDIVEVVGLGAVAAPMFALKGPSMLQHKYPPAFPLKHQQKDLRLVLELGDSVGQDLPIAAATNQLFLKAQEAGLGDQDFSAVFEALLGPKK